MPSKTTAAADVAETLPATGMPIVVLANARRHTTMIRDLVANELGKANRLYDRHGRIAPDANPSTAQATAVDYDDAFERVAQRSPEIMAVIAQNNAIQSQQARLQKMIDDQRDAFKRALGFNPNARS